jgi:predicted transcriptional regulator
MDELFSQKPYAQLLLQTLNELSHAGRMPVRTVILADITTGSVRTVRWYLALLERLGAVERRGVKGGWLPARTAS